MSQKKSILIACLVFVFAIIAVAIMEDTVDVQQREDTEFKPKVTVSREEIGTHSGNIKVFAEVKPRWHTQLKAQIMGEVTYISAKAMAGEIVNEGHVLLHIEDAPYQARLAEAQQALAQADLHLLQTQKQHDQAKADWRRSGLTVKPSDLTLLRPQLMLAQRQVEAAKHAVKAAEKDLDYTKIRAPFSGIISQRFVSKGQILHVDDLLFDMLNQTDLDIAASLSARQWQNLAKNWADHAAVLKDDLGHRLGTASIKRGGGFLDPNTRQYKIFLEVDYNQNILPGEFVYVDLPGQPSAQTIRIPASAYTREHTIWYVDLQNQLRFFDSNIIFYDGSHVVATVPDALAAQEFLWIVHTPLSSYTAGQVVDMQLYETVEGSVK